MNITCCWMYMFLGLLALATQGSCDDVPTTQMQGQTNTNLTFFGKAVDQDGNPLTGVKFEYRVEAYPKDWSFETRGRDNDVTNISVVTDEQGRFQFKVQGCQLIRRPDAPNGFEEFYDKDISGKSINNRFYGLIAWGNVEYRSDESNPAVYVFVRRGAKTVSVLPSRGGFNLLLGRDPRRNDPAWPRGPSLRDVVYKPSTVPTTQP